MVAVPQLSRTTHPSTDELIAGLCETHTILPVQFFLESATSRTGEQRLMAAVLEDAIALHFKRIPPGTAKQRPKFQQDKREAEHWLRSNDRASVFSFLQICEALDLDPQSLRRGLRMLHEQAVTDGHHPRTWTHIRARIRGEDIPWTPTRPIRLRGRTPPSGLPPDALKCAETRRCR